MPFDEKDEENMGTALHYACGTGNFELVKILIQFSETNSQKQKRLTARDRESKEIVHQRKNAFLNAKLLGCWTPLHVAAMLGHYEIVQILLQKLCGCSSQRRLQFDTSTFSRRKRPK